MIKSPFFQILYQILIAAFCVIVVMSNITSAKLIKLPFYDFSLPAGVLLYPLTFLLSDFVTEIYGAKPAKLMVYIAFVMNLLGFAIIEIILFLPTSNTVEYAAFEMVLGLSGLRIFASLSSYIVSQIIDIQLFALIKSWTGMRFLWLRNNGSACISQVVDTVLIDMIYLYWGLQMEMTVVFPIMLISYVYKVFFRLANTPLFYLCVYLVKKDWEESRVGSQELEARAGVAPT